MTASTVWGWLVTVPPTGEPAPGVIGLPQQILNNQRDIPQRGTSRVRRQRFQPCS